MAKKSLGIGEMLVLGIILVCYAVASCTVLAIVNNFTSPKILQNQIDKANEAMRIVFSDADSFEKVDDFESSSDSTITLSDFYLAKKGSEIIGGVIQVAGPTYDKGKIIIGLDKSKTVTGMQFLELTDSPGFGSKAKDSSYLVKSGKTFYDQFTGMDATKGFIINETFDAISGATITSNSVANLMKTGTNCLIKYFESHGVN